MKVTFGDVIAAIRASETVSSARKPRLEFWREQVGDRTLDDLDGDEIVEIIDRLKARGQLRRSRYGKAGPTGKPLAGATVNRYTNEIASIFRFAKRHRLLPRSFVSPTRGIEREPEPIDVTKFYTADDVDRLVNCARIIDRIWGRLPVLIILAYQTGLRRGNLMHLKWKDIDFDRRTVFVERTKNGAPIIQPLPDRAYAALRTLSGRNRPDAYVFENNRGQPFAFNHLWRKTTAMAGVKHKQFHTLRHSFASAVASSGVNQAILQQMTGHSSIQSVARYVHMSVDQKMEAARRAFG